MNRKIYLYAPNVHTGGGIVLLKSILENMDMSRSNIDIITILDSRIKDTFIPMNNLKIIWVDRSIYSRFMIELNLIKTVKNDDTLLCFHGLPSIFKIKGRVIVFIQNRLLIQRILPRGFGIMTRIRLNIERSIVKKFIKNADEIIIQTKGMYDDISLFLLNNKIKKRIRLSILPFRDVGIGNNGSFVEKEFDFTYISSGDAHKNHSSLISAWNLLANENIRPKLALTLGQENKLLLEKIRASRHDFNTVICNLGQLSRSEVVNLYLKSSALVYPSLTESFGLPLLEATELKLPILASERDFVRDVCIPAETFDPDSPRSIARAVKRFMKYPTDVTNVKSSSDFWDHIVAG